MRLYSRQTGSTYLSGIHQMIPADAIQIPEDIYRSVIANPAPGLVRQHDDHGLPFLTQPAEPTDSELAASVHKQKTLSIDQACEVAITAGFQSDALGTPHQYSSQLDDQLNLTGAILRGLDMPYACRDEQGVKAFRLHTAAQLRQVGDDFTLYKLQLLQHANELKQQLDLALEAGDADAMTLIRWEAVQP